MRKFTQLFVVFSLINLSLKALYFGLLKKQTETYSIALDYPRDSLYRVLMHDQAYTFSNPIKSSQIRIYNKAHVLVDTITMMRGVFFTETSSPLKVANRLLWPVIQWDTLSPISNPIYRSAIMELDTFYKFISFHYIGSAYSQLGSGGPSGIVACDQYYFSGQLISDSTPNLKMRLYKLNSNFQPLDSITLNGWGWIENAISRNHVITMSAIDQLSPCMPSPIRALKLDVDTSLNITNCMRIDSVTSITCGSGTWTYTTRIGVDRSARVIPITKNKTMVSGIYKKPCNVPYPRLIVNAIFDQNTLQNGNLFTDTYTTVTYPRNNSAYYSINHPYIVTVGSIGYDSWNDPNTWYQRIPSKLFVNKIDTMGNVIWVKSYGGDMHYYGQSIAFTGDGGCIIVGARHDSTTMLNPLVFENFILKLDADGNVLSTGIFENGKLTTLQAKVYPNPTHSSIRFNVPFETFFDLEIFAIDGRVVFQQKDFNSSQSLHTHEYLKGIYSYRIKTQRQVYQGKFIKD